MHESPHSPRPGSAALIYISLLVILGLLGLRTCTEADAVAPLPSFTERR